MNISILKRLWVEFRCRFNRLPELYQVAFLEILSLGFVVGFTYAMALMYVYATIAPWKYAILIPLLFLGSSVSMSLIINLFIVGISCSMPLQKSVGTVLTVFFIHMLTVLMCISNPIQCNEFNWVACWSLGFYIYTSFLVYYLLAWGYVQYKTYRNSLPPQIPKPKAPKEIPINELLRGLTIQELVSIARSHSIQEQALLCLVERGHYTYHEAMQLKQPKL